MKKEQIKEFIKQVAEIQDLTPKKDPSIRQNDGDEDVVRVGDEWVPINTKSNPTLGFKFIKLKDRHAACEIGCGDIVTNQKIEKRLALTPERHWRTRCATCGKYVSPDGDGFIEGGHQVAAAYIRFFNEKNGVQPKDKPRLSPVGGEITEFEHSRPSKWIRDKHGNLTLRDGN